MDMVLALGTGGGILVGIGVVFVLLLVFVIGSYNSLVTLKNLVKNSWANRRKDGLVQIEPTDLSSSNQ